MSFIKSHLVKSIKNQIEEKQNSVNFIGFFYFDKTIKSKTWDINRINKENAFPYEKVYPITFWSLDGKSLVEIHKRLKNNDFYFYKKINGKDHKIRLKRNESSK